MASGPTETCADADAEIRATLKRWNWGAFLLNWIWGAGNNTPEAFRVFIPVYGLYYLFVLGARGNTMAWQNGSWSSLAEFRRVQKNWALGGVVATISLALVTVLIVAFFWFVLTLFNNSEALEMTVDALETEPSIERRVGIPFETGWVGGSLVEGRDGKGQASLSFRVSGAHGRARVFSEAERRLGLWELQCVRVAYPDGENVWLGACSHRKPP